MPKCSKCNDKGEYRKFIGEGSNASIFYVDVYCDCKAGKELELKFPVSTAKLSWDEK